MNIIYQGLIDKNRKILEKCHYSIRDYVFYFIFRATAQSLNEFIDDDAVMISTQPIGISIENILGFGIIE